MERTKPSAEFGSAIICEDIRFEHDGRHSLMGVISSPIRFFTDDPTATNPRCQLAFYIEIISYRNADVSIRFTKVGAKNALAQIDGEMLFEGEIGSKDFGPIAMGPRYFELEGTGEYVLQGKVDGKNWRTLNTLHIIVERDNALIE